jgi:hypothetical protein
MKWFSAISCEFDGEDSSEEFISRSLAELSEESHDFVSHNRTACLPVLSRLPSVIVVVNLEYNVATWIMHTISAPGADPS